MSFNEENGAVLRRTISIGMAKDNSLTNVRHRGRRLEETHISDRDLTPGRIKRRQRRSMMGGRMRSIVQRIRQRVASQKAATALLSMSAFFLATKLLWVLLLGSSSQGNPLRLRALSDTSLPILITRFSRKRRIPDSFHFPEELDPEVADEGYFADYGDLLDLHLLAEDGVARVIYHDFEDDRGHVHHLHYENRDDDNDQYYAFDDDLIRNPYITYDDDAVKNAERRHCRRTSWHKTTYPNCNDFHANDVVTHVPKYLSYGAYREVFLINVTEEFVWKEIRNDADMEYDNFEFVRMDAMVSERLSSNSRIVDIYGYCGMSLFTEFFPGHDLEKILMPGGGSIEKGHLNDTDDVDPQNDLPAPVKLGLALEIAESIAVLHSYEGGPIVHDDIQPSQFLHTRDGVLKLNDFNRAELLLWDDEYQEYCRYRNGPGQGTYRAPEEYLDKPLDEKIDVFSYGNLIYNILTGLWNFYETEWELDGEENTKLVQQKVINGDTPFIDPRYRTRSFEEGKLVEIMERCWKHNPDDRPSIFEIVQFLREAVADSERIEQAAARDHK